LITVCADHQMKLHELCESLPQARRLNFADVEIGGVTNDSRQVRRGYLFVAIKGMKHNGHSFAADAVKRGASAVISERELNLPQAVPQIIVPDTRKALADVCARFHGYPAEKLSVIGVTGTNGKTTTTYLIKSILEAAGNETGLIGTIRYIIGKRTIPATATTPDPVGLHALLADMVGQGIRHVVIEVSSHALTQERVRGIGFSCAVFMNCTPEHLDYHRSMEEYLAAKLRLFEMLRPQGVGVVNADDPNNMRFLSLCKGKKIKFGLKGDFDVTASDIKSSINGVNFLMRIFGDEIEIKTRLIGAYNVYNCLAAAAAAYAFGAGLEHIRKGIWHTSRVPGRLEPVRAGQKFNVLVDYAHTPDALESVLRTVRELTEGKVIVVFGCGGDRDPTKRPKMGKIAERLADFTWITSDNPRSEDPMKIIEAIRAGMSAGARCNIEPDRASAIKGAIAMAQSGDTVLIAGKGHERYQIFKDTVLPFDDVEVARKAIIELRRGKDEPD